MWPDRLDAPVVSMVLRARSLGSVAVLGCLLGMQSLRPYVYLVCGFVENRQKLRGWGLVICVSTGDTDSEASSS
jgi:hypothetical protein